MGEGGARKKRGSSPRRGRPRFVGADIMGDRGRWAVAPPIRRRATEPAHRPRQSDRHQRRPRPGFLDDLWLIAKKEGGDLRGGSNICA